MRSCTFVTGMCVVDSHVFVSANNLSTKVITVLSYMSKKLRSKDLDMSRALVSRAVCRVEFVDLTLVVKQRAVSSRKGAI